MSPYYLIFREDNILKTFYTNGSLMGNSTGSTGANYKTVNFDLAGFAPVFLSTWAPYAYGSNTIPSKLPKFEIVLSQSIFWSGYRVIISCQQLKKVYEIIFTTPDFFIVSFR